MWRVQRARTGPIPGRGLGDSRGTVDTLPALPGFRVLIGTGTGRATSSNCGGGPPPSRGGSTPPCRGSTPSSRGGSTPSNRGGSTPPSRRGSTPPCRGGSASGEGAQGCGAIDRASERCDGGGGSRDGSKGQGRKRTAVGSIRRQLRYRGRRNLSPPYTRGRAAGRRAWLGLAGPRAVVRRGYCGRCLLLEHARPATEHTRSRTGGNAAVRRSGARRLPRRHVVHPADADVHADANRDASPACSNANIHTGPMRRSHSYARSHGNARAHSDADARLAAGAAL